MENSHIGLRSPFYLHKSHKQQMPHEPRQNPLQDDSAKKNRSIKNEINDSRDNCCLGPQPTGAKLFLYSVFHLIFKTLIGEYHYPLSGKSQHRLNDLLSRSQIICDGVKTNSQVSCLMISLFFYQSTSSQKSPDFVVSNKDSEFQTSKISVSHSKF